VSFLAAVSFDFGNGHALNTHLVQRFFDIIELEWLDDCFDFFHFILQLYENKAFIRVLPQRCRDIADSLHGLFFAFFAVNVNTVKQSLL
jgi:hypothetical protein